MMGGRSRNREEQKQGTFAFVSELSDDRLANYGKYSQMFMNSQGGRGGIYNKEALNYALANEHERRTGTRPDWQTTVDAARSVYDSHRGTSNFDQHSQTELENEQKRRGK